MHEPGIQSVLGSGSGYGEFNLIPSSVEVPIGLYVCVDIPTHQLCMVIAVVLAFNTGAQAPMNSLQQKLAIEGAHI